MTVSQLSALAGLIGIALLAYPACHANKFGRLLARLKRLPENMSDEIIEQDRQDLEDEITKLRDSWTRGKSAALFGGIGLSGLSYLIQLIFVP